jgi:hypothetical protein
MGPAVPLSAIAHARSGDKGNHANIAVLAYTDAGYAWLREHLTVERVVGFLFRGSRAAALPQAMVSVRRYEADNVRGLNFVLPNVLSGGASESLQIDTQGKTLGLALLQMEIPRPPNLEAMLRKAPGRQP